MTTTLSLIPCYSMQATPSRLLSTCRSTVRVFIIMVFFGSTNAITICEWPNTGTPSLPFSSCSQACPLSLDAYYVWIHPTFPALPDPKDSPIDRPMEWLPRSLDELPAYSPSNPLILAVLAIVVMIPMPGTAETNTPAMRRQVSGAIAGRAYDIIAFEAQWSQDGSGMVRNPAHPLVPRQVESVLALCLLGQYEYLQNGNMEKMQSLTREAVDSAIQLQLHIQPSGNQSAFDNACQRAWWTVVC